MNRQKKLARSRRDIIIIIVGCTLLALIGGYVWTRGFGGHMWFQNFGTSGSASVNEKVHTTFSCASKHSLHLTCI